MCGLLCLPFLIAAGVLTGAGAALLQQTLLAGSATLVVLALGMWWLHRRPPGRARRYHPGLSALNGNRLRARDLSAREEACCPFFDFDIATVGSTE